MPATGLITCPDVVVARVVTGVAVVGGDRLHAVQAAHLVEHRPRHPLPTPERAGQSSACVDKLICVFDRLHGSDEFEGHGVGLSIVKRIVEKHDGTGWADGRPDGGATVYLTIGAA